MLDILIRYVITAGIKFGLAWVLHKWPWLSDEARIIISELISDFKNPNVDNGEAKEKAISKIKECYATGCPTDLKGKQ